MSDQKRLKVDINDIPIGRQHAITRAALARKWGLNDRKTRRVISELRKEDNGDGYIIVAYSSGRGYYRTNDLDEIDHFIREMTNRARNTFAPLKKARRVLKEGRQAANG